MKNKYILLSFISFVCLVAFKQANHLTGNWVGRVPAAPNSKDSASVSYTFTQQGDVLTGTMTAPEGIPLDIDSGKVSENNFSFDVNQMNRDVKIKGIYYGDSLASDVLLPNGRTIHFVSMRAK